MIVDNASDRARLLKRGDRRGLASLPVLHDWNTWWRVWGPKIANSVGYQGWVLFILDADEKIREISMLLSRLIRSKPAYDTRGWTEAEWLNIRDQAEAAKAWFEQHCPDDKRVPEWAAFILAGQYGNLTVLARACRELRALQELGYSTVTVETTDSGITVHGGADKFLTEVA